MTELIWIIGLYAALVIVTNYIHYCDRKADAPKSIEEQFVRYIEKIGHRLNFSSNMVEWHDLSQLKDKVFSRYAGRINERVYDKKTRELAHFFKYKRELIEEKQRKFLKVEIDQRLSRILISFN